MGMSSRCGLVVLESNSGAKCGQSVRGLPAQRETFKNTQLAGTPPRAFREQESRIRLSASRGFSRDSPRIGSVDPGEADAHAAVAETGFVHEEILGARIALEIDFRGQGLLSDVSAEGIDRAAPRILEPQHQADRI